MNENALQRPLETVRAAIPTLRDLYSLNHAALCTGQHLTAQRTVRMARARERGCAVGSLLGCMSFALPVLLGTWLLPLLFRSDGGSLGILGMLLAGGGVYLLTRRLTVKLFTAGAERETDQDRALSEQLNRITQSYMEIVEEKQSVLEAIPEDYRHYEAVRFFERVFVNGRAESLKEAMNLYEQDRASGARDRQGKLILNRQVELERLERQTQALAASADRSARIAAAVTLFSFIGRD